MASLQVCLFGVVRIKYAGLPAITGISPSVKALLAYLILHRHRIHCREVLEGFYDEWALRERERLRILYLKSQAHLLRYYSQHELYERALACGRKILDQEPLREEIHREMMRLYSKSGQRPLALRQYETCCQILETELDVPPMTETRTLHTQIFHNTGDKRGESCFQDQIASAQQSQQQLQKALLLLDKTTEQLNQSTRLLEKIFQGYPALEKS
jgi:DNA-binding SARP family transcriptional activator